MFRFNITRLVPIIAIGLFTAIAGISQTRSASVTLELSVQDSVQNIFKSSGRLFFYFSKNADREPRFQGITDTGNKMARNITGWQRIDQLVLEPDDNWITSSDWDLTTVPLGEYSIQAVWKQNEESRIHTPGNLYSEVHSISIQANTNIQLVLSKVIPERKVVSHPLVDVFSMQSVQLSEWWGKPISIKASVLLPSSFHKEQDRLYPVRYNVAGYGGRYSPH